MSPVYWITFGSRIVCQRICRSQEELEAVLANLKTTACPHCQRVGNLIRHGFLYGYDEKHWQEKTVRARRIFCNNRNRAAGCGKTFSIWLANKIKRLLLTADSLWTFLKQAVHTGNKLQAFRSLQTELSDSAPYRIWKRFQQAQSTIRTTLDAFCKPPKIVSQHPAALTLAHLEAAFGQHALVPIAAFQVKRQTFFV